MEEEIVYAYDFFDSELNFVEQKFMSKEEADEHAIETKTIYKLNRAHNPEHKDSNPKL